MAKSFQTEFVKFYKERLEPLGFKKVKGRQPYFVRVVNDEILHVVTYRHISTTEVGYKRFSVLWGVITVYRKIKFDFSISPKYHNTRLAHIDEIYRYPIKLTKHVKSLPTFHFFYNEDTMDELIAKSYEYMPAVLEELDKAVTMDEAIKWFLKYHSPIIAFDAIFEPFSREEALYYARKEYDCVSMDEFFAERIEMIKKGNLNQDKKNELIEDTMAWKKDLIDERNAFIEDEEAYARGMKLLQEQYEANIKNLQEYGIKINRKEIEFT